MKDLILHREQGLTQAGTLNMLARLREAKAEGEPIYQISMYTGEPATKAEIVESLQKISAVFPSYTNEKLAVLAECLYDEMFTAERLRDAVSYVLKNCKYKEPAIADFVSYDRCLKLYTYTECVRMVTRGECRFSFGDDGQDLKRYTKKVNGKVPLLWYRESELIKFRAMK